MQDSYKEKLKSPKWQKMRLKVFERDKWKCAYCGVDWATLHVHHKEYTSNDPWKTDLDNLITLCERCHTWEHIKRKIKAKSFGAEGFMPAYLPDCALYREYGGEISCMSGSGGSICSYYCGSSDNENFIICSSDEHLIEEVKNVHISTI